ncbi:MAG: ADP-L-glycero-D-manno-heptose 6-epimerase, partial [Cyclobacteriaceae bacterium]
MIVVTGASGFIGSCLVSKLNLHDFNRVVVVDFFEDELKRKNLEGKTIHQRVNRDEFEQWLNENHKQVEFIFHLGARTDTAEFDRKLLDQLNTAYSKMIWTACCDYQIPLVYASSAATYGLGEHGFTDDESLVDQLTPLNPYGDSKNEFDSWALKQTKKPFFWVGLKFFNVYGPNEYHKTRMASVIFHAFNQIKKTEAMKLFRSHNESYKDGEQ